MKSRDNVLAVSRSVAVAIAFVVGIVVGMAAGILIDSLGVWDRFKPVDSFDVPYPEKLVLDFYEMVGEKDPPVELRDFLPSEALVEYDNNNLQYFGFGDVSGN